MEQHPGSLNDEKQFLRVTNSFRRSVSHVSHIQYTQPFFFPHIITIKQHREANPSTPIVAVAPPHVLRATLPSEMWRYFNEILEFPVSAATVRGLATRWLLGPPELAAVAASAGMAGVPIGTAETMEATTPTIRSPQAVMGNCSSTDTTNSVSSLPGAKWGAGAPSQQQQQQQHGGAVWELPSSAEGGKAVSSPSSHLPDFCTRRYSKGGGLSRVAVNGYGRNTPHAHAFFGVNQQIRVSAKLKFGCLLGNPM